jgi:hypothetical protein
MIHALGFSENAFDPHNPGRLCRGRERWIDPWPVDDDATAATVHRVIVTGARFSDDSAADALRGVPHSGIGLAAVLNALLPRHKLVAFCEDGHPADIPEGAEGVELYTGHRAGGRVEELRVRWLKRVSGVSGIQTVLGDDPDKPGVRVFALLDGARPLDEDVMEPLFLLAGMAQLDSPPALFQPAALPAVFGIARAVVLLHRDKHGPALGLYSLDPVPAEARLHALAEKEGALLVPFAIPPMLARWDRALLELREKWLATRDDAFPVPPAPEPAYRPRHADRRRRMAAAAEE